MIIKRAQKVLKEEAEAIKQTANRLDDGFKKAVEIILKSDGKVIVVGMGKSGLIGRKIAATLSSTGTPSVFLHAGEGLHGDLGVVDHKDTVMILSYSGTTGETASVFNVIKKSAIPIITVTGNPGSDLAKNSDAVILISVEKEACPMNLVPTTSTTVMLAIGDALAITLLEEKGFKSEDFATLHPGGTLGKKLLLKVDDIINNTGANPIVKKGSLVKDVLLVMTSSRVGATSIVDSRGKLAGYFTDGDLRRHLQDDNSVLDKNIDDVMTHNPTTINAGSLAIEAREILKRCNFDNIPVVDKKGFPIGIIDERDILKEGL